jgi:hypothetical protein
MSHEVRKNNLNEADVFVQKILLPMYRVRPEMTRVDVKKAIVDHQIGAGIQDAVEDTIFTIEDVGVSVLRIMLGIRTQEAVADDEQPSLQYVFSPDVEGSPEEPSATQQSDFWLLKELFEVLEVDDVGFEQSGDHIYFDIEKH